jgi:uncharacterized protein YneF (UPF0154 family)
MGLPTVEHFLFIPAVLLVGIVVGYIFGSKAARTQLELQKKRARE